MPVDCRDLRGIVRVLSGSRYPSVVLERALAMPVFVVHSLQIETGHAARFAAGPGRRGIAISGFSGPNGQAFADRRVT